jgi:hypothetical protein
LHVNRRRICGDVDLGKYVEEKSLLGVGVGDKDVEKVLQSGQLWNQFLNNF